MADIQETIRVWSEYCDGLSDWQSLVEGTMPKQSGCGPIYEIASPLPERADEDFCIADMRQLPRVDERHVPVTEPHYHPEGVTEIYFVLQGIGRVFVGKAQHQLSRGSAVVMTPGVAHFTIPEADLVMAVVNTPPFEPEHYIPVHKTRAAVQFDAKAFERLT